MKINTLYLPLNKKETICGWILAPVYIAGSLLLGAERIGFLCLLALAGVLACVALMGAFHRQTLFNAQLLGKKVWLRPIFAVLAQLVISTCIHDIFMFYEVHYFVASDWGPALWDIRAYILQAHPLFWLLAAGTVLILPVIEELIFRQLIFTTFYPKSKGLAFFLSVALFAAFHCVSFIGMMEPLYVAIYSLQFIPMGLLLCWLYCSTDSILSPILMHALCNALVVYTAWGYLH